MVPEVIDGLVYALAGYLACGLVFWIALVGKHAGRLDPDARQTTLGFKLVILPGVMALWPVLLRSLLGGGEPAMAAQPWGARWRRWHGHTALLLAVGLPIGFAWAITGRDPMPVSASLPADPRFRPIALPLPADAGQALALQAADAMWQVRLTDDRIAIVQTEGEPRPDLLAYWASQAQTGTALEELPQDARLLGPVAREERTWARPEGDGMVILFGLAHGEVVAQLALTQQPGEVR
jgi:hypothetical protein